MAERNFNFLDKIKKDFEDNIKKMQNDFNKFFGIEKKSDEINKDTQESIGRENNKIDWKRDFDNNVQNLKKSSESIVEQMKRQWEQFKSTLKTNNGKFAEKIKENNEKIKKIFEEQHGKMDTAIQKIEKDFNDKKIQNREQFLDFVNNSGQNWNSFVMDQQEKFEKTLAELNKHAWKTSFRIILIIIPLIAVLSLLFSLIRGYI